MENFKKYLISLGYTLGIILVFTLIISILNYFDLFNDKVINILKLVIPIISTIVGGFFLGKSSDRNGYMQGIKFGLLFVGISFLISIIFKCFVGSIIIFYIIIILSSMFGSMIGINKKSINES